jgi:FkbM family methyltransferase
MKSIFNLFLSYFLKSVNGKKLISYLHNYNMQQSSIVIHNNITMHFIVPNWINAYRVNTFASKEPETLEWVESMKSNSNIWDIGANVGLYSIYASKLNKGKVYAFEPSVFNLEVLARNIFLNKLQKNITIIPIPLSNKLSENLFQMTSTELGGALSTFAAGIDQNGKPLKQIFEYKLIGISLDELVHFFKIPLPDYIKIDVDGIEHLILSGASQVLLNVRSVLIEIDDNFVEQAEKTKLILENSGLILLKKCKIDSTNQYNQWWYRP